MSLADDVIAALSEVRGIGSDLCDEHPMRHAVLGIKRSAETILADALRQVTDLAYQSHQIVKDFDAAANDSVRLNAIAAEYLTLEPFDRPTGGDDADVGWRVLQQVMGEQKPRVLSEVFEDNPRSAIDAAMVEQKGGAV